MGSGLILLVIVGVWLAVLVPMGLRSHDGATPSRSAERLGTAVRVLSRRAGPASSSSSEDEPGDEPAAAREQVSPVEHLRGGIRRARTDGARIAGSVRLPRSAPRSTVWVAGWGAALSRDLLRLAGKLGTSLWSTARRTPRAVRVLRQRLGLRASLGLPSRGRAHRAPASGGAGSRRVVPAGTDRAEAGHPVPAARLGPAAVRRRRVLLVLALLAAGLAVAGLVLSRTSLLLAASAVALLGVAYVVQCRRRRAARRAAARGGMRVHGAADVVGTGSRSPREHPGHVGVRERSEGPAGVDARESRERPARDVVRRPVRRTPVEADASPAARPVPRRSPPESQGHGWVDPWADSASEASDAAVPGPARQAGRRSPVPTASTQPRASAPTAEPAGPARPATSARPSASAQPVASAGAFESAESVATPVRPAAALGAPWNPVPVPRPLYVSHTPAPAPPRPAVVAEVPEPVVGGDPALVDPGGSRDRDAVSNRRRAVGDW